MKVYTENNLALELVEPPLSSGGEGAVYEIVGYPKKVVKIYHDVAEALKRELKIQEMVKIGESSGFKSSNIGQDIAWPLAALFNKNADFIGFGMDRIAANMELDDIYVYPPKTNFLTIKDRIACAISICDVIERLHHVGQVFGDFNPNNIKVNSDWTVRFVDADSYHINSNGNEYRCIVCAQEYVAPEVIRACRGTNYADCKSTTFTAETDKFALAIHIFRMLMNGCHPFSGERHTKRVGSAPAAPIDRRVENGETPFFKTVSNSKVPHFAPDINMLPPTIINLFRRAFLDGHVNPQLRPSATEWKNALIRYNNELVPCSSNSTHYHWKGYYTCPYCEADSRYSQVSGVAVMKPKPKTIYSSSLGGSSISSGGTPTKKKPSFFQKYGEQWIFWGTTLAITIVMQILLGYYMFPQIYSQIFDYSILVTIGVIGSMISGLVGSITYNTRWSSGMLYEWWEYVLSVLTALGFSIAFGVILAVVGALLYLAFLLLVGSIYVIVAIAVLIMVFGALLGG